MADLHGRFVNTAIWRDDWFLNLRSSEQHLFIYLLTCPASSISGVYKLGLAEAAFHTKIEQQEIKRIFEQRFAVDKKAFFEVGWVVLTNFLKHQRFNPNMWKSAQNELNGIPKWLKKSIFDEKNPMFISVETVSNGYLTIDYGSITDANGSLCLEEAKVIEGKVREEKGEAKGGPPKGGNAKGPQVLDVTEELRKERENGSN